VGEGQRVIARLRRICLALPEAEERETWETPTFRVRDKIFCLVAAGGGACWVKAPPGVAAMLIEAAPERFFRPPYLGHKGWIGITLGRGTDWEEVAALVARSHGLVAPKRRVRRG
jgi:predicted DNA-binding protein (MmcQ/YjbR family)